MTDTQPHYATRPHSPEVAGPGSSDRLLSEDGLGNRAPNRARLGLRLPGSGAHQDANARMATDHSHLTSKLKAFPQRACPGVNL